MSSLSDLVHYLILRVGDEGGTVGKTKIVKLLYLIDVEHFRRYRKTLTGLHWIFYHYGPYTAELEPFLKNLPDLDQEEVTTKKGYQAKVYRSSRDLDHLEESLGYATSSFANKVIKEWALDDLNTILDHVYFETEPMLGAVRGEPLDFDKIPPIAPTPPVLVRPTIPRKKLEADKKRFKELVAAHKNTKRLKLDPPPRFDDIYYEALDHMNAEESRRSKEQTDE